MFLNVILIREEYNILYIVTYIYYVIMSYMSYMSYMLSCLICHHGNDWSVCDSDIDVARRCDCEIDEWVVRSMEVWWFLKRSIITQ